MPYSTDGELLAEFSEQELAILTGDPTGTAHDTNRTNYARSNADALIDSYLQGRYEVPFKDPVDPVIRKISTDLTVVHLYEYFNSDSSLPNSVTWRKIYAMKLLKDLQQGTVTLPGYIGGGNAPPPIVNPHSGRGRFFGEDKLNEFLER